MIVVRDVFHCKYGMGGALVELMKEMQQMSPEMSMGRVMSDASGRFDTIVTEWVYKDLAEWERAIAEEFANPDFPAWFRRMQEVVESGSREFYRIELGD